MAIFLFLGVTAEDVTRQHAKATVGIFIHTRDRHHSGRICADLDLLGLPGLFHLVHGLFDGDGLGGHH